MTLVELLSILEHGENLTVWHEMSGFERMRRRFLKLQEKAAIREGPARLLALLLLLNFVIPLVFGELVSLGFSLAFTEAVRADTERAITFVWIFAAIQIVFVSALNIKNWRIAQEWPESKSWIVSLIILNILVFFALGQFSAFFLPQYLPWLIRSIL